jgi:HK97 family phage portal protein
VTALGLISKAASILLGQGQAPKGVVQAQRSSGFVDAWGTQREPSGKDLVDGFAGVVHSCASLNAASVAATPLRLYVTTSGKQKACRWPVRGLKVPQERWLRSKRNGVMRKLATSERIEEVVDHPVLDLLDAVNKVMDNFDLFEITQLYQEIVGLAYWFLDKDALLGVPHTVWVLPAQYVHPEADKKAIVKAYKVGEGADAPTFPAEDVLVFHVPSLRDPYLGGWSPARAAWEQVKVHQKVDAHTAALLDNRARPDSVIVPDEALGPAEAERLQESIRKRFRKGGTGGLVVLESAMKMLHLAFSNREIESIKLSEAARRAIANNFGVPLSKLDTQNVNRANAEAGDYQHMKQAVLPRCRRNEQRLTHGLAWRYDGRLFFAYDNPVPDDLKTKTMVEMRELQTGKRVINEVRDDDGLPPVEWGEKPWLPGTLIQPGEEEEEEPEDAPGGAPPPPTQPEEDKAEEEAPPEKVFDVMTAVCCKDSGWVEAALLLHKLGVPADQAPLWVRVPETQDFGYHHDEKDGPAGHGRFLPRGEELRRLLVDAFQKQRRAVFRVMREQVAGAKSVLDSVTPIDLQAMGFTEEMVRTTGPYVAVQYDKGAKEGLARVGLTEESQVWAVVNPRIPAAVEQATMRFCAATNATTSLQVNEAVRRLRNELAAGIVEGGNTIPELTKRVSAVFDHAEKYRAKRIATTESSRAVHQAEIMTYKESGMVSGKRWLLSGDACDMCQDIAAEQNESGVPLDGNFGKFGEGDYSIVECPPAHPNCMCTIEPVLGEPKVPLEPEGGAGDAVRHATPLEDARLVAPLCAPRR